MLAELLSAAWPKEKWDQFQKDKQILDRDPSREGWLSTEAFDENSHPRKLSDQDGDGLPQALEANLGTLDTVVDSDGDGWSDAAEFFLKADPLVKATRPEVIVADGSFGDWAELHPSEILRLTEHNQSSSCRGSSDIIAYAGQKQDERMVISFLTREAVEAGSVWELEVRSANWHVLIERTAGGYESLIHIPGQDAPVGKIFQMERVQDRSIEFTVDWAALGLNPEVFRTSTVEIKLSSYKESKSETCDTTPWLGLKSSS
jgi:hypothetical protein